MNDTKLHIFDRATDFIEYQAGAIIVSVGDPADKMFVVKEGEVEIQILPGLSEIVEPGGFFGEMALITREARSATAVAKTDCKLVPVDPRRFEFMVQETPGFALTVMRVLVERLRRSNAHVAHLLTGQ